MSEVFEGVVCRAPAVSTASFVESLPNLCSHELSELPGGLSVIYCKDPRRSTAFTDQMDGLARKLSQRFSQALLVCYDSRIGHRSSRLYLNGQPSQEFGAADELFVPLDDNGEPISSGPHVKFADLAADEEYETTENAIQLGLGELGSGNWVELKQLIGRG